MQSRLADRLNAARRRQFVGRAAECALFREAVSAADPPFTVLFLHGPGGVGKSTLLRELVVIAGEVGATPIHIDGRSLDGSPEALLDALGGDPAALPDRPVILIDGYELLAPIDGWIRNTLLPQLPATAIVVLACRSAPSLAWRSDPAWSELTRTISLRNLSPAESAAFLERRSVPASQHPAVLSFTHGHPLALSLVADVFAQRRGVTFEPGTAPDVVKLLLEQFVQQVPGPAHRAALEACAMVRLLNESLLAEMLGTSDARDLFDWLRGLSFIEAGADGLYPHDLAREALTADVRWRNPEWYSELHKRARASYSRRIETGDQRTLFDYIFLHRDNPVVRPFLEWQTGSSYTTVRAEPGDREALLAMVRTHEGTESARLAEVWLDRQPRNAVVYRDPAGLAAGYVQLVRIDQASADEIATDPGVAAAAALLAGSPLRSGEAATVFRFWMARDSYQDVSPVQSLVFVTAVGHYLTTPNLAFTFFPVRAAEFWAPMFAYADLTRLPAADFTVAGVTYGMYGHDWRAVPPVAWLNQLASRETGQLASAPPAADPLIVLSEAEFSVAVGQALRGLSRAGGLRDNPLLRSRLAAGDPPARTLEALIRAAGEALRRNPKEAKLYGALYHTYLDPAPTQEQAAERLDVPFSTYRRHLRAAVQAIVDRLWRIEIGTEQQLDRN